MSTLKNSLFHSIRTKFILVAILSGLFMFGIARFALVDSLTKLEEQNIEDRLLSEINYVREHVGGKGSWELNDGRLCLGDTSLGNGTEDTANITPFLEFEDKTKTFAYTFKKVNDEGLVWVGDKETGYMQGHFLRVAGSTLGPNGESIVGTYMDKKVADVLDEKGIYTGPANVNGRQIYCVYQTLIDDSGSVVGAIVVGRSMEELHAQIHSSSVNYIFLSLIVAIIVIILLLATISPWINSTSAVEKYLHIISSGTFPDEPLEVTSTDEMGRVSISINEMAASLKEKEILRQMATTDPLTKVLNRAALEGELKLYMDWPETKGALFMLDLDKFKDINDSLGHPVGDELLIKVAGILKEIFRSDDIVCRLGGDEFVCFAKSFTDKNLLIKRAEQINEKLRLIYDTPEGRVICVSASVGIAIYPDDAQNYDDLYTSADKALYEAKQAGRDCYRFVNDVSKS